ncbi:pentapeptide repeat-containing protein [Kordia antarctica]|nr:pentapeptide repeat-containing protein [Kordia antarctica]
MIENIIPKETIAYYNRKFKIEKGFFKNLFLLVKDNPSKPIDEIASTFFNVNVIKVAELDEKKVYGLIFNSLERVCYHIIWSNQELFSNINFAKQINCTKPLQEDLERLEIEIDFDFFYNYKKNEFIQNFTTLFQECMITIGVEKLFAGNLTFNFERLLYIAMIKERSSKDYYYQSIGQVYKNDPFKNFTQHRKSQELYLLYLTKFYTSTILGDQNGMTLANLYVAPDFSVFKECLTKEEQKNRYHNERVFWSLGNYRNVHDLIYDYTENEIQDENTLENAAANCLMILGYPGQGKTSLCYRTLYNLIEERRKLDTNYYLIKLRNISETKELINNPIKVISSFVADIFEIEFERKEENLVILDGLDELYMKEGLNSNDIDEFCRELGNASTLLPNTKFIITSRYGYVNLERLKKNEFIVLSLNEFDVERQQEWVAKYRLFHPDSNLDSKQLEYINQNIEHVSELIRQPILLHLISKVEIDYDALSNRTDIYNKLFDTLIGRKWEKKGQIDNLLGLTKTSLRRYIRDIALSIFQGDYEYIRKKDLEELPATQSFLNKLEKDNLRDSLKSIMISFYFQEVKRKKTDTVEEDSSNYAIEFLHKSLQEYLVAEKVWHGFLELIDKRANGEYFIDTWQDALEHISDILSSKIISKEVTEYLIELIQNEKDIRLKNDLKERLQLYFNSFLNVNFHDSNRKKSPQIESAINTFYGFWTIFSHLDIDKNYIPSQYKDTFVQLLKWSLSQRHLYYNLSYQDLSHSNLKGVNFHEVDLNHTDLSYCSLQGASFENASITKSNFYSSELHRIDFSYAMIYDTDISYCTLINCNLSSIIVEKCDFAHTDFLKCFYLSASFENCNFTEISNMSKVDLYLCEKMIAPNNLDKLIKDSLPDEKLTKNTSIIGNELFE